MRGKIDITALPEYHKSLEGGFLGAGFSLVVSYISLFVAAKYSLPTLYIGFLGSLFALCIFARHIYVNLNNALVEIQKPQPDNKYIARDTALLQELRSYLDFDQMQRVKQSNFAGSHDVDDFKKVRDYVHYFSDVDKNFMTTALVKESGELYEAARNFSTKFALYNSPNNDMCGPGYTRIDISTGLRDGTPDLRARYYREVEELSRLADIFHSKYESFIHKANMILKLN